MEVIKVKQSHEGGLLFFFKECAARSSLSRDRTDNLGATSTVGGTRSNRISVLIRDTRELHLSLPTHTHQGKAV